MSGAQDKRTNNLLSGYPPDGPNSRPTDRFSMHSLPRESMKKVFGIETKHLGYVGQRSSFSPKKLVSTERNQPVGVFAGQGGPNPKLDRFQMHSIPKETMKKVFGQETKHLGYKDQDSSFRSNKFLSADPNCPTGVFAGPGGPSLGCDRFKMHSIPKETMKKVFGQETKHLGYVEPTSSFRSNKFSTAERNQPVCMFGPPGMGPYAEANRFTTNSLSKEVMATAFGIETKHLGYVGQRSSFAPKKLVSTERNQPIGVFAGQGGPDPKLDRFQMHSIPKETMKKVFGIETKHLGFQSLKPTVRDNIGVGFGRSAKTTGSTNIEDIHWRQQLKQEGQALERLEDMQAGRAVPGLGGGGSDSDSSDDDDDWDGPSINDIGTGARRRHRPRPLPSRQQVARERSRKLRTRARESRATETRRFVSSLQRADSSLTRIGTTQGSSRRPRRDAAAAGGAVDGAATTRPRTSQERARLIDTLRKLERTIHFREGT